MAAIHKNVWCGDKSAIMNNNEISIIIMKFMENMRLFVDQIIFFLQN